MRVGVAPPDLRFDVVREDDGGAGQPPRQVDGGEQEVADEQIEPFAREQLPDGCPERARSVLADGVGQKAQQVPGGLHLEPHGPLLRVGARHGHDLLADLAHAVDRADQR